LSSKSVEVKEEHGKHGEGENEEDIQENNT
jgi:hypothetical protein